MKGISFRKDDEAVAVVIGALMTFVIVSSLLGAYILWYVPSNGQQQDMKFLSETQNSLFQLQDKMSNTTAYPNEFVIESFPLGIPGTPPFSPSTDTSLALYNSSSFRLHLSYSLSVNFTYSGHKHERNFTLDQSGYGQLLVNGATPFITPTNYYFQNGAVVLERVGSNYSSILGHLPFQVSGKAGTYLNASQVSLIGNNSSIGGYGATLVTLQYAYLNQSNFFVGENVSITNNTGGFTTAVVDNINLTSFYYNISTPQVTAWNASLAKIYNSTGVPHGSIASGILWNLTGYNFTVFLKHDKLSIFKRGKNLNLYSVALDFFALRVLQI